MVEGLFKYFLQTKNTLYDVKTTKHSAKECQIHTVCPVHSRPAPLPGTAATPLPAVAVAAGPGGTWGLAAATQR